MTSTAAMSSTIDRGTLEKQIHKLKLDWIMAKNDEERARASQQIQLEAGKGPPGESSVQLMYMLALFEFFSSEK